jgi:DNA-binding NarL/FixJ family response regulator
MYQKSQPEKILAGDIRVLMNFADGFTVKDLASSLHISERSAHLRVAAIREKLGASTNEQMVARAFRLGLID